MLETRILIKLLIITCMLPIQVHAQSSSQLEEIIVTAEKRDISAQDVAVSMTAISDVTIENFGVDNFRDYMTLIPGLSSDFAGPVSNLGTRPVGLRGIQTLNGTLASGQNTVGFYINNTPIPISNPRLVDLARIEVLRGPQGTLYGSSSLGGTIKIVTKRPETDEFSGRADLSVSGTKGGDANYEFEGVVNIPVNEQFALRASGYYEENSGYIDFVEVNSLGVPTGATMNEVNDEQAYGARIEGLLNVTDDFSVRGSVSYNKREVDAQDEFTIGVDGLTAQFPLIRPGSDESILADIEFVWNVADLEITSTTAYYDQDSSLLVDQSRNAIRVFNADLTNPASLPSFNDATHKELSHETRIVSQWDSSLQFIAGVFYTDREENSTSLIPGQGAAFVFAPPFTIPNDTVIATEAPRDRKEFAVYGQLTWEVNEWLSLVAGLRYFDFEFDTLTSFVGTSVFVVNESFSSQGSASEDGVIPRFRVELRPSEDHLLYFTAAKGFRMGGANFPLPAVGVCDASINAFFGQPTLPDSYESDTLWSFEVGAKTSWFDNRLTANISGFHIDWDNTQVQVQIGGLGCGFGGLSTNVGSVESNGLELELNAAPTDRLSLSMGVSYIDSTVQEDLQFPGAVVVIANEGDVLPDIPEWTVSLLAQYRFPITDTVEGFVRGDWRYQDARTAEFDPSVAVRAIKEGFSIVNFRLGVDYKAWEAALYIENALDERPFLRDDPAPLSQTRGGQVFQNTIRPRTIGVNISRSF